MIDLLSRVVLYLTQANRNLFLLKHHIRIPIDDAPVRLETDCSQYAMGGVLSQLIDGKWHPITYRSEALSPAERNYEIHDQEFLAVMNALADWRQYLMGAQHPFEIWTDHRNLTYFRQPRNSTVVRHVGTRSCSLTTSP